MDDRIGKKVYYKIEFELLSPLTIGSGIGLVTDKDIVKDRNGRPYIPGSALAGVVRQAAEKINDEQTIKKIFGNVIIATGEEDKADNEDNDTSEEDKKTDNTESMVIIYDAYPVTWEEKDKKRISVRDFVALDDNKTAKKGAKFDMEIMEPGINFVTYIEVNEYEADNKTAPASIIDQIVSVWKCEGLYLGAKTTRGYGKTKAVNIYKKAFEMNDDPKADDWLENDALKADDWLDFDMYSDNCWGESDVFTENCKVAGFYRTLDIGLKLMGGISVRRYTTRLSNDDVSAPDYEQLTLHDKEDPKDDVSASDNEQRASHGEGVSKGSLEDTPVIPGTTWAGAFRHRMNELVPECELRDDKSNYFGTITGKKQKSIIYFGESYIKGGSYKVLSRNAIDRFSGGTVDGALFTEKTYYGGTTRLQISFSEKPNEKIIKALAMTIQDIHCGFLAVGGLTAIGRGLFRVTDINGKPVISDSDDSESGIFSDKVYKQVLEELEQVLKDFN